MRRRQEGAHVKRFWNRDRGLGELEGELRARRSEPPAGFVRALAERAREEERWLRPRVRIAFAVGLVALSIAAVASAGGFNVVTTSTTRAVHVVKRISQPASQPVTVSSSPGDDQYKNKCGSPPRKKKCNISIEDAKAKEGNAGSTAMVFKVDLDNTSDQTVTASWTTQNGSATGGSSCAGANTGSPDYISRSDTVTFSPGTSSATITIVVCGDTKKETDETFSVKLLSSSPNAEIARATGTGTIVNDDK
jgi:hypothetical protein